MCIDTNINATSVSGAILIMTGIFKIFFTEHNISDISVSLRGIGRVVVVFNRGPSGSRGDRISALDFERAGYIEFIGKTHRSLIPH